MYIIYIYSPHCIRTYLFLSSFSLAALSPGVTLPFSFALPSRLLSRTSVAMLTCRYGNARAHTCKVHTSLRTRSLRRIFPVCSLTVFL